MPDRGHAPEGANRSAGKGAPADEAALARRRAALDAGLVRHEQATNRPVANASRSDLARGLKLSSEFIAGVVVGALIGYLLDRVLGSSPFGLIVFLLLGFAAGLLNVLREVGQLAKPETRIPPAGNGERRDDR